MWKLLAFWNWLVSESSIWAKIYALGAALCFVFIAWAGIKLIPAILAFYACAWMIQKERGESLFDWDDLGNGGDEE